MKAGSLLEKIGLTARDLIVIVLIVADIYLVATGHQQLDANITRVEAQTSGQCQVVAR